MTPRKLLFTVTSALALACAGGAQAETFRLGTSGDLYGLDPHSMTDSFTVSFLNHVYEALVRYDADLKIEPALATSWDSAAASALKTKVSYD